MSRKEVLEVLVTATEPVTASMIAQALQLNVRTVTRALSHLLAEKRVQRSYSYDARRVGAYRYQLTGGKS